MPQPLNTSWITLPQSLSSSPSPKPSPAPLVDLIFIPRIHSVYGNPWASLLTVNIQGLKTHKAVKPLAALSICLLNIVNITVKEPLKKVFSKLIRGLWDACDLCTRCWSYTIERFHVTSRWPYWCSKTMKRRPCYCTQKIIWELNSFLM